MSTRTQVATEILRDRILRSEYAPGFHLQEAPLSVELGVSRTPVRAALAALASEGLLDYGPNRGYLVRGFSLTDVLTAYEVRANLEGFACRLAAEQGLSDKDKAEIEAALAIGDAILAKGQLLNEDRDAWIEMNDRFHVGLIRAADNWLLEDLVQQTYRVPLASSRVVHWYEYDAIKGSHELHHRIYRCVRDRRGAQAEPLMREHIYLAIEQIRDRFENEELTEVLQSHPQTSRPRSQTCL
ncbi:MAG: GntR family transcriptional regulator [Alphaproteobacteria bacterium]|nr:GntR family transcriptional regulator [Alphaproteobacteria bacterium]